MKKNVLSLSIQAMFGGYDGRQSVECIDYGPAGHVLVVPYFKHQPSPILRFINQNHYRIDTSNKRVDKLKTNRHDASPLCQASDGPQMRCLGNAAFTSAD